MLFTLLPFLLALVDLGLRNRHDFRAEVSESVDGLPRVIALGALWK